MRPIGRAASIVHLLLVLELATWRRQRQLETSPPVVMPRKAPLARQCRCDSRLPQRSTHHAACTPTPAVEYPLPTTADAFIIIEHQLPAAHNRSSATCILTAPCCYMIVYYQSCHYWLLAICGRYIGDSLGGVHRLLRSEITQTRSPGFNVS
jgi:hypothetical protein